MKNSNKVYCFHAPSPFDVFFIKIPSQKLVSITDSLLMKISFASAKLLEQLAEANANC